MNFLFVTFVANYVDEACTYRNRLRSTFGGIDLKKSGFDANRGTPSRVMTVNELADFLRVHRSTVYRLLKSNSLPAFRVGSDWRFNTETVNEWMNRKQSRN